MRNVILKPLITGFLLILLTSANAQIPDSLRFAKRVGLGTSYITTFGKTHEYLDNKFAPLGFIDFSYNRITIGLAISVVSHQLKKNIPYYFWDSPLPKNSNFRFTYFNWYLSYQLELGSRFLIEPHVGYISADVVSSFKQRGENYDFASPGGLNVGLRFSKLFMINTKNEVGFFIDVSYNQQNFDGIYPKFSNDVFNPSAGLIIRQF